MAHLLDVSIQDIERRVSIDFTRSIDFEITPPENAIPAPVDYKNVGARGLKSITQAECTLHRRFRLPVLIIP